MVNKPETLLMDTILRLVLSTERQLDPWIEDIICDNISTYIMSDKKDDELLEKLITEQVCNTRLRLRIIFILSKLDSYQNSISGVTCQLLNYIEEYPCLIFKIFSDSKWIEYLASWTDHFEKLIRAAEHHSLSPNFIIRDAAILQISYLSCWNIKYFTLIGLNDEAKLSVVSQIYDSLSKETAIDLLREHCKEDSLPSSLRDNYPILAPIHAYIAANTQNTQLNFKSTDPYWQSFYKQLFSCQSFIPYHENVLAGLCANLNVSVLSSVCQVVVDKSSGVKDDFKLLLLSQFEKQPILQTALDILYDDCGDNRSHRAALALFNNLSKLMLIEKIVEKSHVCHHYVRCDVRDVKCFYDTIILFLSECRTDQFGPFSDIFVPMFNSTNFEDGHHQNKKNLRSRFNLIILRKLRSVDSRVRDLVFGLLRRLEISLLDADVVSHILEMTFMDPDFTVRTSCYQFLAEVPTALFPDKFEGENMCVLERQLRSVEFDDSMVAIAFFQYFRSHYKFYSEFIDAHICVLSSDVTSENPLEVENTGPRKQSSNYRPNVDDIINDVCGVNDCADVPIITNYSDKLIPCNETESCHSVTSQSHVISDLFKVITADRCDIERVEASLDLVSHILANLTHDNRTILVRYLVNSAAYFKLLADYKSLYLKSRIDELRKMLASYGFQQASSELCNYSEDMSAGVLDLTSVIALLQSTPDPNIIMDCY